MSTMVSPYICAKPPPIKRYKNWKDALKIFVLSANKISKQADIAYLFMSKF